MCIRVIRANQSWFRAFTPEPLITLLHPPHTASPPAPLRLPLWGIGELLPLPRCLALAQGVQYGLFCRMMKDEEMEPRHPVHTKQPRCLCMYTHNIHIHIQVSSSSSSLNHPDMHIMDRGEEYIRGTIRGLHRVILYTTPAPMPWPRPL